MIWLVHPTGNAFVRALLRGFEARGLEYLFWTTFAVTNQAWWLNLIPNALSDELRRRAYPVPRARCRFRCGREILRLWRQKFDRGWRTHPGPAARAAVDEVYWDLDRHVARKLSARKRGPAVIYAYEDGAYESFGAARRREIRCAYELPIAYWEISQKLLQEEAQRWPEWEPTLGATRDSREKCDRKTVEADLADLIICPSEFVRDSLPRRIRENKPCVIAKFGSPPCQPESGAGEMGMRTPRVLRVLFAGSLSQRKGLADVFAAFKLLKRRDVQLVVFGSLLQPLEFYRRHYPGFQYESPRPHAEVLKLFLSCDVLVLPSIVEGRALVQQEALSCGLPLLVTANAGGCDLVEEGKTGFLVPIRAPEKLAERINWFADHPAQLAEMRKHSRAKAEGYTWDRYATGIQSHLTKLVPEVSGSQIRAEVNP